MTEIADGSLGPDDVHSSGPTALVVRAPTREPRIDPIVRHEAPAVGRVDAFTDCANLPFVLIDEPADRFRREIRT